MACESTNTRPTMEKDILVYQTTSLGTWCAQNRGSSTAALERAVTYIDGAFDRTRHSCTVDYETDSPYTQRECRNETWDGAHPCASYSGPWTAGSYFYEWLQCKNKPTGDDATILLSSCNGSVDGGKVMSISDGVCWATTGRQVAKLPSSYDYTGSTNAHRGMETVLHELGHVFMKRDTCADSDHSDHHYGKASNYGSGHLLTPMGIWNRINPSQNACCESHNLTGTRYYDMSWSDCSIATWGC